MPHIWTYADKSTKCLIVNLGFGSFIKNMSRIVMTIGQNPPVRKNFYETKNLQTCQAIDIFVQIFWYVIVN